MGAPYDAFYIAAYAIAALGARAVTGPALARAIPRLLPPGDPVDVGPAGIYQALDALGAGKGIDLGGHHHLARLRPRDRRRRRRLRRLLHRARAGRRRARVVESGLVFRARAGKLEGALHCP